MVNRKIIRNYIKSIFCILIFISLVGCTNKNESDTEFQSYYQPLKSEDILKEGEVYYADSQILITAIDDATYNDVNTLVENFDGEIIGYISATNDYQIYIPNKKNYAELEELISNLKEESLIEDASVYYIAPFKSNIVDYTKDPWINADNPTDTSGTTWDVNSPEGNNWWAEAIDMPSVWNMDLNTQTVKVGIMDTMFDITNEDLDENLFVKTWNNPVDANGNCDVTRLYEDALIAYNQAVSNENQEAKKSATNAITNASHGTHVAGIIGAQAENGFGIAGINQNVELYGYALSSTEAFRSEDAQWGGIFQDKCALACLLNEGVKVINLSMSYNDALVGMQDGDSYWSTFTSVNSRSLESFLLKYIEKGNEFLIIKSAGNNSDSNNKYNVSNGIFGAISNEAVSKRIIIVGAATYNVEDNYYSIADFSNIGNRVDVYAPGVKILSDMPTNITALSDGTSMSTPIVTGLASLIWGINPNLSSEQVRSIILASANTTMFDFDDESFFISIRDLINSELNPTAIVDANICVKLAQDTIGISNNSNQEYGTLSGVIYGINSERTDFIDINIESLSLYDENNQLVSKFSLEDIAVGNSDEDSKKILTLHSYSSLVEPGKYTLKAEVIGYETQTKEIVINANDVIKLDFEFVSLDDLVTDAYTNNCTYTTNLYNFETKRSEETEITCVYNIPKINLSGNEIEKINKEIYNTYYPIIEDCMSEVVEYGYPCSSGEISYRWSINGDILSLVILNNSYPDSSGINEYMVYNISISNKVIIPNETVISTAGLSESEFYKKSKEAIGSSFWKDWEPTNEIFADQYFVDFFNEQLEKSVSNQNIKQSYPYINEKGQLCIIVRKYSFGDADYYWDDLNLVEFELSPYYASKAEKITHEIKISEEEAYKIACDYWNYTEGDISDETGFELYLVYDGLFEEPDGNHYYTYRLRWWVTEGNHMSTVDYVYINAETGECSSSL